MVGALPSLQTSAGNLEQVLRQAGRGASGSHNQGIRRYIVVAEIALSLVLVCGAFLLFKSLLNLQQIETGVRIENVITMSLDLPAKTYPTPVRAAMFYESARERIRGVPGIQQAAFSTHLPLRWIGNGEGSAGVSRLGHDFQRPLAACFRSLRDFPVGQDCNFLQEETVQNVGPTKKTGLATSCWSSGCFASA